MGGFFRIALTLLFSVCTSASWGYSYDVSLDQFEKEIIESELQKFDYDDTLNLCYSGRECRHSYLQKKTQGGSFFAFEVSLVATKGIDANTLQRTHSLSGKRSAKNVDGIADSMRKDGFVGDSIDVVEHNGQRFIIDGHHRAAAARRTGTPVNVNVVNDIKGHRSNFNSIDDVLDSAGSVGPDSLKPRRGR